MKPILRTAVAAMVATFLTAASASAAPPEPPDPCIALASEWTTTEAANTTNSNLGKARALAAVAETKCKSPDPAQRKIGASKYEAAIRLFKKKGGDKAE